MVSNNLMPDRKVITPEKERLWDSTMVSHIIRRYDYTGAMVNGRTRPLFIGDKRTRVKPKTEWSVIDGINEPIVPIDLYNEANLSLTQPRTSAYITKQKYPLKGKLRCGNCHHALSRVVSTYKEYYVCPHGTQIDKYSECCREQYPVNSIEHTVWWALKDHIRVLHEAGILAIAETKREIKQLESSQKNLNEKVAQLKEAKIQQYELYASGIVSREVYLRKKEALSRQIESVEQEIKQYETSMKDQDDLWNAATEAVNLTERFSEDDKISIDVVDSFVEVVYVYDPNRIEIVFRFEDFLSEWCENSDNHKKKETVMSV